MKQKEIEKFERELIQAAHSLANAIHSGQSLTQAMISLEEEDLPALKNHIVKINSGLALGQSVTDSLLDWAKTSGNRELAFWVMAIIINHQTGGNLAQSLRQAAVQLKERHKVQARVHALTAQARLSATVVGIVPFLMLLLLCVLSPETVQPLFTTMPGISMLITASAMVVTGTIIIKRMCKLD